MTVGDVVFSRIRQTADGSVYLAAGSTLAQPVYINVKHSASGKAPVTDRHLAQYSKTKLDSNGNPHTLVLNVTLGEPRNDVFTAADVELAFYCLLDIFATLSGMTAGNIADFRVGMA